MYQKPETSTGRVAAEAREARGAADQSEGAGAAGEGAADGEGAGAAAAAAAATGAGAGAGAGREEGPLVGKMRDRIYELSR